MYKNNDNTQGMIPLISYKCLVLDTDGDKIEFCKTVKNNPNFVSEVIEIGNIYLRFPEKLYDELITFLSGKKIILVECVNIPKSISHRRFEFVHDEESVSGFFYIRVKTNVNKLIMSNGHTYYVLSE